MSKLAEFRQLERHLAEQLAALEVMKGDKGLKHEIEFETKLRELLGVYSKSLRDVIAILDPQAASKGGRLGIKRLDIEWTQDLQKTPTDVLLINLSIPVNLVFDPRGSTSNFGKVRCFIAISDIH